MTVLPTKSIVVAVLTIPLGIFAGQFFASSPGPTSGVLLTLVATMASLAIVARAEDDRKFIIRLWIGALAIRFTVAVAVHMFGLRDNIAPDWSTYDAFGQQLAGYWKGQVSGSLLLAPDAQYRSGWGMYYYVAAIYYVIGRNPMAIQLLSCVFGANACVLVYHIAGLVYPVRRVSRLSGVLSAVAPSMVIWTAQGIKEPLIVFLIPAVLFLTLKLSRRITLANIVLLLGALFGVYALRHYVFYVVFLVASATLVFATRRFSPKAMLQGSLLVLVIATVFAYYGAGEVAEKSLDLKRIQSGREWSAGASGSGYGGKVDITDTRAALAYLPLGILIFLFAPFPWMVRNMNHVLMLPEMVVWWLAGPLLLKGFLFSVRHRLRASFASCLLTVGLTVSYALYLTNFGTAHRMRVQVLWLLFIFVSIGWELRRVAAERGRDKQRSIRHDFRPIVSGRLQDLSHRSTM